MLCSLYFISEVIIFSLNNLEKLVITDKEFYGNILELAEAQLIKYIAVIILGKILSSKKQSPIPLSFTFIGIAVAANTTLLGINLLDQRDIINEKLYVLALVLCLILNFMVFYSYEVLSKELNQRLQNKLAEKEVIYYHNQAYLLEKNSQVLKNFRHDFANHILTVEQMIRSNQTNSALEYLSSLSQSLGKTKSYCSTGNVAIDCIVNYKLSVAVEKEIDIKSTIKIPSDLTINSDDIIIILENLLDNAIEATSSVKNRIIQLKINYNKGILFIYIMNTFN